MLGLTHGGLASRAKKSTISVMGQLGFSGVNFDNSGGGVAFDASYHNKIVLFFANTGTPSQCVMDVERNNANRILVIPAGLRAPYTS